MYASGLRVSEIVSLKTVALSLKVMVGFVGFFQTLAVRYNYH
jgi:site-specific recombinase XerD